MIFEKSKEERVAGDPCREASTPRFLYSLVIKGKPYREVIRGKPPMAPRHVDVGVVCVRIRVCEVVGEDGVGDGMYVGIGFLRTPIGFRVRHVEPIEP